MPHHNNWKFDNNNVLIKKKNNENLSVKYKYFYKYTTQNLFIIHKQIK